MNSVVELRPNGSKRVQYFCDGPSLTRQEFKDECDLGKIIAKFSATPEGRDALEKAKDYVGGRFEDVSSIPDYRSALDQVKLADEAFMRLPAIVRTRFDNDPALFLDFIGDPKNSDELVKMGLLNRKPEVPKAPVVPPVTEGK